MPAERTSVAVRRPASFLMGSALMAGLIAALLTVQPVGGAAGASNADPFDAMATVVLQRGDAGLTPGRVLYSAERFQAQNPGGGQSEQVYLQWLEADGTSYARWQSIETAPGQTPSNATVKLAAGRPGEFTPTQLRALPTTAPDLVAYLRGSDQVEQLIATAPGLGTDFATQIKLTDIAGSLVAPSAVRAAAIRAMGSFVDAEVTIDGSRLVIERDQAEVWRQTVVFNRRTGVVVRVANYAPRGRTWLKSESTTTELRFVDSVPADVRAAA